MARAPSKINQGYPRRYGLVAVNNAEELAAAMKADGARIGDIAQRLGVSAPTALRTLNRAAKMGLINWRMAGLDGPQASLVTLHA